MRAVGSSYGEGAMMKSNLLLIVVASAAMLPGCDQGERQQAVEATQANAAADEQAVRAVNDRWLELIRNKDAVGISQLYAEDGAVMPQGEPIQRGREAIANWWGEMMAMPGYDLTFEEDLILFSSSGDMALDRGTYRFRATPASGPIEDAGKYVVVWRKIGNDWKVAADIFNSDRPASS